MDDIVTTISEHSESNMKLLTSTSEGLVAASVAAAEAEKALPDDGDEGGGRSKTAETVLEETAEEFTDIFTTSTAIRQRLETRLLETQHHLALAHDEEHAAKREVAKMKLEVVNSKAEIRRVWNEAQEKLKTLKETEMRLMAAKEQNKKLEARAKATAEQVRKHKRLICSKLCI